MLAQRKLTQRGWSIALRTPYEGSPVYARGNLGNASNGATRLR